MTSLIGLSKVMNVIAVQIFPGNPVVIESICYHARANQLKNESNVTGWLKKIGRVLSQQNEISKNGIANKVVVRVHRQLCHIYSTFVVSIISCAQHYKLSLRQKFDREKRKLRKMIDDYNNRCTRNPLEARSKKYLIMTTDSTRNLISGLISKNL